MPTTTPGKMNEDEAKHKAIEQLFLTHHNHASAFSVKFFSDLGLSVQDDQEGSEKHIMRCMALRPPCSRNGPQFCQNRIPKQNAVTAYLDFILYISQDPTMPQSKLETALLTAASWWLCSSHRENELQVRELCERIWSPVQNGLNRIQKELHEAYTKSKNEEITRWQLLLRETLDILSAQGQDAAVQVLEAKARSLCTADEPKTEGTQHSS